MKCAAPLILLLCLASPLAAHPAAAAQLSYTLYVLGLPVADAVLSIDLGSPAYRVTLRFRTTGLADLVAGDRLEEHANGRFEADRPAPLEYTSNGRLHGQDRVVDMSYRDGAPVLAAITPPNEAEREDVPAALRARTIDPLSVIVMLLHLTATTGRCEGSARAYDGRRLQQLDARTAGEEDLPPSSRSSFSGRGLRCEFTDQTLAGFRIGSGRDDDLRTHRGTIWLSQVLPGVPRLPVRASVETRWLGDAMIYLTAASP
jgi:hypothetical protein